MPERRHSAARAPVLAALALALIGGGLVDRLAPKSTPPAQAAAPVPVAAPPQAYSSSWFCGGATDGGAVDAPGAVVIANDGTSAAAGVVTVLGSDGRRAALPVTLAAGSSRTVREVLPGGAAWVAATVDMDAGAVAVDQAVFGSLGYEATPCATAGSSSWYFANGFTLVNGDVELSLLNPYPTVSVADLSFTTDQGVERPEDFQGLVVPANGMLNVDLRTHLRRRSAIATTVSVRTGKVVAWETDWASAPVPGRPVLGTPAGSVPLADPAFPVAGVSVILGSPSPATYWVWPEGVTGGGLDERYLVYNPGPSTAEVRLSVKLLQGYAEPFSLSVGPYDVLSVVSGQQARIPGGVHHAAVLVSTNGVPVVAERVVLAGPGSSWRGFADLPGGRVAADDWLFPAAPTDVQHDGWLVIYNPGAVARRVSVDALGWGSSPVLYLTSLVAPPGRRVVVHLNPLTGTRHGAVVLVATGPLYAECDVYGTAGAPGASFSFGVPLEG